MFDARHTMPLRGFGLHTTPGASIADAGRHMPRACLGVLRPAMLHAMLFTDD